MCGSFLVDWEGNKEMSENDEDEINQVLFDYKNETENWITEFGSIDHVKTLRHLNNQSALHMFSMNNIVEDFELSPMQAVNSSSVQPLDKQQISSLVNLNTVCKVDSPIVSRCSEPESQGIMPDTEAAGVSTAGQPQVTALPRKFPKLLLNRLNAGEHRIRLEKVKRPHLAQLN